MTINLANPPARTPSLSNPDTFEQDTSAFLAWMATIASQIDGQVLEVADIERGSNANGEYVRFPDGTQFCTRQATSVYQNADQIGLLWSYPAAFFGTAPHFVSATASNSTGDYTDCNRLSIGSQYSAYSASQASVGFNRVVGASAFPATAQIANCRFFAIGRWF